MHGTKTILITGASGNLGAKLRRHMEGRYCLRLLDIDTRGDPAVYKADLSRWEPNWTKQFQGVDIVYHLAADPTAKQTWPKLLGPNVDSSINVFEAAVKAKVRRLVFASSNHVMGGYKDDSEPVLLTTSLPPRPGTRYEVRGEHRDSTPYACTKLFGERLSQCLASVHSLEVLAVRFGWVRPGGNEVQDIPPDREAWFRLMWLSDRDYCHLMDRCLGTELSERFVILHGMSANTGMRWDLESTRRLVGYEPRDDVTRPLG